MLDKDAVAKYALYLAIILAFIGYTGTITGIEPIYNQFFAFAAWTYLLLADNLSYRLRGNSLLISRTGEFFALAGWSVGICAAAELLNLRLGAWDYFNQSSDLSTRWTGRLLSWAAVMPSLFITAELLEVFSFFGRLRSRPFKITASLLKSLYLAGAVLLTLAAAAPGSFWPLAVPALFLLADTLNLKLRLPSLLGELAGGLPAKPLRLAAAGLVCGLLWNWWNSSAGSGWGYAIPAWLSGFSWALYAGLPLAALAAYALGSLASWPRSGRGWQQATWVMPGPAPHPASPLIAYALIVIISYIALRAVDAHTVKLYLGWV